MTMMVPTTHLTDDQLDHALDVVCEWILLQMEALNLVGLDQFLMEFPITPEMATTLILAPLAFTVPVMDLLPNRASLRHRVSAEIERRDPTSASELMAGL